MGKSNQTMNITTDQIEQQSRILQAVGYYTWETGRGIIIMRGEHEICSQYVSQSPAQAWRDFITMKLQEYSNRAPVPCYSSEDDK